MSIYDMIFITSKSVCVRVYAQPRHAKFRTARVVQVERAGQQTGLLRLISTCPYAARPRGAPLHGNQDPCPGVSPVSGGCSVIRKAPVSAPLSPPPRATRWSPDQQIPDSRPAPLGLRSRLDRHSVLIPGPPGPSGPGIRDKLKHGPPKSTERTELHRK